MVIRAFSAWILACFAIAFGGTGAQAARQRHALVIANSTYAHLEKLDNPATDAHLVAASLERAGFSVTAVQDADRSRLVGALRRFIEAHKADEAEALLVYLAGHGVQLEGEGYFLGVDLPSASENDILDEGLSLRRLTERIVAETIAKSYIFVVDACREFVVSRRGRSPVKSEGLPQIPAPIRSLISYSTSPGSAALDGRPGEGSPFAQALASAILMPSQDIEAALREVRRRVYQATDKRQITWEHTNLVERFQFVPEEGHAGTNVKPAEPRQEDLAAAQRERARFEKNLLETIEGLKRSIDRLHRDQADREKRLREQSPDSPRRDEEDALRKIDAGLREARGSLSRQLAVLAVVSPAASEKEAALARAAFKPESVRLLVEAESRIAAMGMRLVETERRLAEARIRLAEAERGVAVAKGAQPAAKAAANKARPASRPDATAFSFTVWPPGTLPSGPQHLRRTQHGNLRCTVAGGASKRTCRWN